MKTHLMTPAVAEPNPADSADSAHTKADGKPNTPATPTRAKVADGTKSSTKNLPSGNYLWIKSFQNRGKSISYRVQGQLPEYGGPRMPNLLDNKDREVLFPGRRPRYLRDNYHDLVEAKDFMDNLEGAYQGLETDKHHVYTSLRKTVIRKLEAVRPPLNEILQKDPDAIETMVALFMANSANVLVPISLQQIYRNYALKRAGFVTTGRLERIGQFINGFCRGIGHGTGAFNFAGEEIYDVADLQIITKDGLTLYLKGGSSTFSVDDIKELPAIIDRWKVHSDALSALLWQSLSSQDQILLSSYQTSASSSNDAQVVVVQALNRIIGGPGIYESTRFQGISLRPETTELMKGGSIGPSLARLNRLLLEDAYPLELSRNLGGFPYESGQQRLQAIRQVLDFAVDQGYIRFNPARGVRLEQPLDEKKARAEAEIVVDTNEQVQIALNIAATCALAGHKPGYFVPHVVLMYYAAMRPYAELRRMNPRDIRLHKELIRIFSSKTLSRRIKTLPMNAVIMLRHYWDGKPLSFDGWHQFHRLVRAAQGYKVTCAAWFQVEPGTIDVAPDVPRHTGCSHGVNLFKDLWDAIREDNHGWSTFKRRYDGLFAKEETAIFCSLFPYTLDVTAEELKQAHKYLVKHDLIAAGDPLPSAPVVMHFDATPPKHELWLPKCSDDELRDKIWDVGIDAAAKELGTYPQWLGGICRAKRIPTPRGRESRERPQDAPIPPPLTTLTDGELAELIATSHGIKPAAEKLDINSERMRAYCAVRGIPVPSAHARAVFYNKRPKVKKSRKEVSRLLGQFSIDEVAAQLGVTPDHLKAYCRRRGIQPGSAPGSKSPSITLEEIKAGVLKDLEIMPHHELTPVEAMELVLSRVPDDLDQADLIELVDQTTRIKLTLEQIKLIVKHTAKGRFYLHEARIRLLGAYEFPVDLDWLHTLVKPDLGRRDDWNLIKALRCVLPKTAKGLSVDQLLKVLPWFRIHWNEKKLKKELGRLDRHNYICFYYNRVTLPGGSPIGHLQGHKEPTVGFDAIKAQAVSAYRQLASQELTNVEMMQFVFGMAPNGLWREELLDIAKTCGVDFKAHCIDSVVKNEAKGQFDCEHGRVRFVGTPKHWNTIDDLRAALPARNGAGCLRGALVLRVLQHFPDGLKVGEIWTATKLGGHNDSRDTVRRQIYKYRKKGLVRADNGQVWLVSPGKTLADQISPMDKAA